jgi:hypothetical protein
MACFKVNFTSHVHLVGKLEIYLLYKNAREVAPESKPDNLLISAAPKQSSSKSTTIKE